MITGEYNSLKNKIKDQENMLHLIYYIDICNNINIGRLYNGFITPPQTGGWHGTTKWFADTENQGLPGKTRQIYNVKTEIVDNDGKERKIRPSRDDIGTIQTPDDVHGNKFTDNTVLYYLFTHDRKINE